MSQPTIVLPLTRSTLAAAYHAGDTELVLAPGGGALAPTPAADALCYVVVVTVDTLGLQQPIQTVFSCTGRTGDTLTGVAVVSGADQYYPAGAIVYEAEDPATGAGVGTVVSITAGTGLAGGTITDSGTISFATVANLRVLANISGGTAVPSANTATAILDAALGSTQGDVLYRGASAWAALAPGTAGQFLQSGGAAANVAWATLPVASASVAGVIKVGSGLSITAGVLSATGGTGTVTSVTLAGAHGVTLSGTNPITTSGTITVSLGDITPSSVAATGTVTGSNLSGTNTGDQTITLTGDVTGSGVGSFATTIAVGAISTSTLADGTVTFPKIQAMTAARLLGNPTGSSAAPEEISLGSGLAFSGTSLVATGSGGTVTSITAGTGLSGGTITSTGTIALSSIGNNSVLANISGATSPPTSIAASALVDSAFGSAQGSVLYRGSSAWATLGPGSAGQVLTTHGAGVNPTWVDVGSGTVTAIATTDGITGGIITSTGTIGLAAIATQRLLGNVSGSSAPPSAITLSALLDGAAGTTRGTVLFRDTSSWAGLGPGTAGQVLTTQGGSASPTWGNATGTVTSITAGAGLDGGTITSTGTIALSSIASHQVMANTTGGAAAPAGVSLSAAIDAAIANAQGDLLYRSASAWSALAPGTSGQFLQTQGAAANPAWATLPVASASISGTVKVGSGLLMSSGTLSATGGISVAALDWFLGIGSDLAVADGVGLWRIAPIGMTVTGARAAAIVAPTGADAVFDVERSTDGGATWTSLWATTPANRPTIAAGAHVGISAGTPDTTAVAAGDLLRANIDQVGSTIPGRNVTLQLVGLAGSDGSFLPMGGM